VDKWTNGQELKDIIYNVCSKEMATFTGGYVAGCVTCHDVENHAQRNEAYECKRHGVLYIPAPKKKHHEGNGKPKGLFAGTLTMGVTTPETEETMVKAIKKIMNQQTCPVKKYKWYVEYTERGLPHVHFMYETYTGGRIHAKVFMRYWKLWDEGIRHGKGFQGGYHKEVNSEVAYDEYIQKDGGRFGESPPIVEDADRSSGIVGTTIEHGDGSENEI